jgi:hypothetical protein
MKQAHKASSDGLKESLSSLGRRCDENALAYLDTSTRSAVPYGSGWRAHHDVELRCNSAALGWVGSSSVMQRSATIAVEWLDDPFLGLVPRVVGAVFSGVTAVVRRESLGALV